MSFPRVNPRLLHPIHSPARIPHIRCIRTTPLTFAKEENQGWSIRNAYLAGESGVKKFSKRVMVLANRNLRKKQGELRIPLVPKVGDNEKLVPLPDAPKINEKIRENRENWTEEELVEDRELQLREEKIEEFSLERKKVKGLSSKEREQKWLAHAERGEEVPDNIVYPRDVIGKRFRKEKVKYTVKLYNSKNFVGFVAAPANRQKMAQTAAEIIQEYHQHMHGEKLEALLVACKAKTALPEGIELEKVDVRHLQLPFPPEAILPTMRLVFATMQNKVRFALTDLQINTIATGHDFLKQLLNPPQPVRTNEPTYLYNQLTQIQFPPNVTVLPDRQLEKREKQRLMNLRSLQARARQAKEQRERLQAIEEEEKRQRVIRWRQSVHNREKSEQQQEGLVKEKL